jgi:hypothetical protein
VTGSFRRRASPCQKTPPHAQWMQRPSCCAHNVLNRPCRMVPRSRSYRLASGDAHRNSAQNERSNNRSRCCALAPALARRRPVRREHPNVGTRHTMETRSDKMRKGRVCLGAFEGAPRIGRRRPSEVTSSRKTLIV